MTSFPVADNREQILYYVRDIANPSLDDQYFPVARHKDFYLGHSWASGVSGGTRTQESSSEAKPSISTWKNITQLLDYVR